MTDHAAFEGVALNVSLTVKDLDASTRWYAGALGFAVEKEHERQGKLIAVSLKGGAVEILLTQDDGAKGLDRAKGEGFSMQFTTAQPIDALAQRIRDYPWPLATEPTDFPWGARAFRVADPDGFRLTISTPR